MSSNTPSKILFILKRRTLTSDENETLFHQGDNRPYFKYCMSSGLRNSAKFVVDMLNENGVEASLVEVVDNNDIDREVTKYKPTHVIIEAYWVVPDKFDVLSKLHPNVKWIIRNHSELPFLANEGIALDWTMKYMNKKNVYVSPNNILGYKDLLNIVEAQKDLKTAREKIIYLPNYYKITTEFAKRKTIEYRVHVGCFGAVRPFKNHLVQASAAIKFAMDNDLILYFHVNVARIENHGNPALKSLRSLFANLDSSRFKLVEHGWLEHADFLKLVASMDIGLQVSFTESFNIVAADFVSQGIPIVVSKEIEWMPNQNFAEVTDSADIAQKMEKLLNCYDFWRKDKKALRSLHNYNDESVKVWLNIFKSKKT